MSGLRLCVIIAFGVMLLLLTACSGGDKEAFGFRLPVPTLTPRPSVTPITDQQRADLCPELPGEFTLTPGEAVNLYEVFEFSSATDVAVLHDGDIEWLIGNNVAEVLQILDRDVELQSGTVSRAPLLMAVNYPRPGHEQCQPGRRSMDLVISQDANLAGFPTFGDALAPLPAGFSDAVLNAALPVTPTFEPFPTSTPWTPEPTRTPIVIPNDAPFFEHPEDEELRWEGPNDQVRSRRVVGFCSAPDELAEGFGIPAMISLGDVESGVTFWAVGAEPPLAGLRWTGYEYAGWEIWQGEDPLAIYLLHSNLPDIAFVYRSFPCF